MNRIFFALIFVAVGFLSPFHSCAQTMTYLLDKKIPLPGEGGYDYLSFDSSGPRLYISHGDRVLAFDVATEKLAGSIEGLQGVHGIALAREFNRGFISDGKGNSVVVFDLTTLKTLQTIAITGKDPDAIMYEPVTKKIFAFNGDSQDASVIDPASMTQTGTVALGGHPEFAVADGQGLIFNNLEDKSRLNVIDARTLQVTRSFPLDPCGGPTGLAIDKGHGRLFTACRKNKGMSVIDIASGKVVATIPIGAGVDAVAYNPATGYIYCSNGDGTATLIHQDSADRYSVVQTLATQWKAKTLALDPGSQKIYLVAFDMDAAGKNRLPGTFKLLIYKPKA